MTRHSRDRALTPRNPRLEILSRPGSARTGWLEVALNQLGGKRRKMRRAPVGARELAAVTRAADVLVVAIGHPNLVTAGMVKEGAAVVDVGITRTETGLTGDVAPEIAERAGFLTPVPGGVGPMTIAMLLANTIRAARYRRKVLAYP